MGILRRWYKRGPRRYSRMVERKRCVGCWSGVISSSYGSGRNGRSGWSGWTDASEVRSCRVGVYVLGDGAEGGVGITRGGGGGCDGLECLWSVS